MCADGTGDGRVTTQLTIELGNLMVHEHCFGETEQQQRPFYVYIDDV